MDKLLTTEEVAGLLCVQQSTIYQCTHQGFIPHVKIGKLVRFRSMDIEKWVNKNVRKGRNNQQINIGDLGL